MNENTVKKLALTIAANCVHESMIEEYISQGKLSQEDANVFNRQMTNKLYTFLTYLLNKPAQDYAMLMESLSKNYPQNWDMPELDPSFTKNANQAQSSASFGIQQ
ncbi:hypothetical protein ACWJJH_11780 [Endozoicomonadaceae bacterium StTr2]